MMPTTRPRYTLTETPELAEALDAAGEMWPELRNDRAALLRRLIDAGYREVAQRSDNRIAVRTRSLRSAAGAVTGVFPARAADGLKSEWPE